MKILVISNNYPSHKNPSHGIFVYKLIQKFVEQGHEATVIAPQKFRNIFKKSQSYGPEKARVFRPLFPSFSAKQIVFFNTYLLTHWAQKIVIMRAVKNHRIDFDVVYSHFLHNAFISIEALKKYQKPFITALGESDNFNLTKSWFSCKRFNYLLKEIKGYIAVSEQIKEKLLSLHIPEFKIIIEPNATNLSIYNKGDKRILRKKYYFPEDKFIVAFTGNFIERKGPHRLLSAIEGLDNIGAMMIGGGPIKLKSKQILFKQRVPNHIVHELLNCADVFVLPTRHEGSSNAIIEAMACGLPIISSDIPEISSQCDPSFSILVDPMDIDSIRRAILTIFNDPGLRDSMSKNALAWSRKFDLNQRAARILDFISTFVNE